MTMTRNSQSIPVGFPKRGASNLMPCPPAFLEYTWYASLAYAMLGEAWGIVIPAVGGVVWMLVAAACLLSVGSQDLRVYKPIALGLWTGIIVIAIESIFHEWGQKAISEGIAFLGWLALLIIVQSLSLRPGFLQRFVLVALVIGLATLPYVNLRGAGQVTRAFATGTGLSNGNVLGMWFGFCTVYFVFWGLQLQRPILRATSWAVALGCLYMVLLTVSRAPLLAVVLGCIVGFRSELKRGFVPLLSLALLTSMVYVSGVFDTEIGYYTARGGEKSGRERLWPVAIERISDSPWIGVGLDNIGIRYSPTRVLNPHNGPLHIALGSGIFPLLCFLGYLAQAGIGALRIMRKSHLGEAALLPPLVVFALMEIMVLDATFMSPWTVVVLGMAISSGYDTNQEG